MSTPGSPDAAVGSRARKRPSFFRRLNWPLVGVLLLLAILLVVSTLRSQPAVPIAFDPDSTADNGLRGLTRWLENLGYPVRRTDGLRFALPAGATLLFVYPNQLSYTAGEAAAVRQWVEQGGTLVLVGPHPEDGELEEAFGVHARTQEDFSMREQQTQPLIEHGAQAYRVDWSVDSAVLDLTGAPAAVPVLTTAGGDTTMAVQAVGDGVVWHLAPGNAFTNHGLQLEDHGDFLPPILRTVPPGGVVVFDTFHQFGLSRAGEQIATLQDWIYRTPTGWATLFGMGALGLFLVLQGRRLGPSVPTAAERRRREAGEYVQAMAALARRARLSDDVAHHQQQRLKRGLARRRAVSPDLPNAEFLIRLSGGEPPFTPAVIATVSATLHALEAQPGEQQLVDLAAKVDQILHDQS